MENTTENIFRFVQLRPPLEPEQDTGVDLVANTAFARDLAATKGAERGKLARSFLARPDGLDDHLAGEEPRQLLAAQRTVLRADGTVKDMRSAAAQILGQDNPQDLRGLHADLSDTLLAIKFAGGVRGRVGAVESLFRLITLLVVPPPEPVLGMKLRAYLRRPLTLPSSFRPEIRPVKAALPAHPEDADKTIQPGRAEEPAAEDIQRAIDELLPLARPGTLRIPNAEGDTEQPHAFALTERAIGSLSRATRAVIDHFGLRPADEPIDEVLTRLDSALSSGTPKEKKVGLTRPSPLPNGEVERPYLRDVGIADLLVVKQHLKRYQRVDIAHIENVLKGETKSRNHRAFERIEETVTTERETTQEKQTELETADRFEMNRETARTVQRDQQLGFGLTVSGKYGPTVEFSSNLQGTVSSSTEETAKSATTYAQDVVSRSLERVVERVREEQVRKVVREQEETNLHTLENGGGRHISGVYQFVEKVYESQIFNYGLRQMFDFVVPEPASYVWHVETFDAEYNLPAPPPKLESYVTSPAGIDKFNYLTLAAKFGAEGVTPPPPLFILAAAALTHGQDADEDAEEGHPRSIAEKDIAVPEGYRPYKAFVRPQALTDHNLTMAVTVGHSQRVWRPSGAEITDVGEDHKIARSNFDLSLMTDSLPYDPVAAKLAVQVLAWETNSYSVAVEVKFMRTEEGYVAWQLATYAKLVAAYRDLVDKHEQKVEELKAIAEAEAARTTIRFGAPPSQNQRMLRNELKKHCISITTRQRYEDFDITQAGDPPFFDFDAAAEAGSYVRFFEQAFEWDQMQYVFYPYFWGRADQWSKRFLRQDVDQQFLEFLQAGAARVVVPVRPGFEIALTHYLETGEIWNGEGEPPVINSPLYVPIVTEIQERTGGPQGEIPVGEPWATQVPTPLVILRPNDDLPTWIRPDPDVWQWQDG